jgi:hypothetical protein
MTKVHVTDHAIDRYIERVENISRGEALARIMSSEPAIALAAKIGCSSIKLGGGIRLALDGPCVVSVYGAKGGFPRSARKGGRNGRAGS